MIFRAVFWIGLVALLAPHEPDLGLGRPGAGTSVSSSTTFQAALDRLSRPAQDCGSGCAGGLGLGDIFWRDHSSVMAGLADVKAQITADQRARATRQQSH
jgi:hypothetical protein